MAYAMTKQGSLDNAIVYEFVCDTIADMNAIEKKYKTIGSIAVVLNGESEGLEVYIAGSDRQWNSLSAGAGAADNLTGGGLTIHICTNNEVSNGVPSISEPDESTVYLVSNNGDAGNLYDEYIYVNNNWEKWGSADIDLSGYAPKASPVFTESISLGRKANTTVGTNSYAVGTDAEAFGANSHAEGYNTIARGTSSHAEGSNTTSSGSSAHAEGAATTASGSSAHAEGAATTASGAQSHAEGINTSASGERSHTEGAYTTASHMESHAEGYSTKATGSQSHAEGMGGTRSENGVTVTSEAKGTCDHTEGYICRTASGQPGNHAEGFQTSAIGGASHSEGIDTIASGSGSHAEGSGTKASNSSTHAEGYETTASGFQAHAEGSTTTASGASAHSEGYGTIASGDLSHTEGQQTIAAGSNTHAEGYQTNAFGSQSHAEGQQTIASGLNAHAEGQNTAALGICEHVFGRENVVDTAQSWTASTSYAVGDKVKRFSVSFVDSSGTTRYRDIIYRCKTANSDSNFDSSKWEESGQWLETVGNGNGGNSRSNARALDWDGNEYLNGDLYVGCNSDSTGGSKVSTSNNPVFTGSISLGRKANTTVGEGSITLGYDLTASGAYSIAEGDNAVAAGNYSHAEGSSETSASATWAHAEGGHTQALDRYTHSEGSSTVASKEGSHAEGINTVASGQASHAEGYYSIASAYATHAEGQNTVASGMRAHAEGKDTVASGNTSHAEGEGITALGYCEHALGRYNKLDTADTWTASTSYTVGALVKRDESYVDGSGVTRTVTKIYKCKTANSDSTFKSSKWEEYGQYLFVIGNGTANNSRSNAFSVGWTGNVAEGSYTTASGYYSHAEGLGTTASNETTHAEGTGTTASGGRSHAEGTGTTASGNSSHTEGSGSVASGTSSHAEGSGSVASGYAAHAEGDRTVASGYCSHAEGQVTTAIGAYEHVSGQYNVLDTADTWVANTSYAVGAVVKREESYVDSSNVTRNVTTIYKCKTANSDATFDNSKWTSYGQYLFVVGNGTGSNARSNAYALDWNGNERLKGDLYVGCNADSTGGTKVIPIPTVTAADNGKSLEVINGEWAVGSEKIDKKYNDASSTWSAKTWSGLTDGYGNYVWIDRNNIYYSCGDQYVLDKSTSTWSVKTWSGLTDFYGQYVWTDGDNIYYSDGWNHYVLDKTTSTWSSKTWNGLTEFDGEQIWTEGDNIYFSNGNDQYVLNKLTSTWSSKTWNDLTYFYGQYVWSDGENIYFSDGNDQYVLDKSTSTWSIKEWNGLTDFSGDYVWSDGNNIYYSAGTDQYILNKSTSTWSAKTWGGLTDFYGGYIWTDGNNIYYSGGSGQYELPSSSSNKILLGTNGEFNAVSAEGLILPTVTNTDNGKFLTVTNGAWGTGDALPAVPSSDGIYNLQATVSSGTITYSWVAAPANASGVTF